MTRPGAAFGNLESHVAIIDRSCLDRGEASVDKGRATLTRIARKKITSTRVASRGFQRFARCVDFLTRAHASRERFVSSPVNADNARSRANRVSDNSPRDAARDRGIINRRTIRWGNAAVIAAPHAFT